MIFTENIHQIKKKKKDNSSKRTQSWLEKRCQPSALKLPPCAGTKKGSHYKGVLYAALLYISGTECFQGLKRYPINKPIIPID